MTEETFGELIKKYRERSRYSKTQLAKELHVVLSTVSHWEDDSNIPTGKTLRELARLFKLSQREKIEFFQKSGNEELVELAKLESQSSSPRQVPEKSITNFNIDTGGGDYIGRDKATSQNIDPTHRNMFLQRPPRASYFTGRKQEIEQILQDVQLGRIVTICGPSGIGKTALASQVVQRLMHSDGTCEIFSDGIIAHDFSIEPQAEIFFTKIALAFSEEPIPTALAAAQRVLASRRVLLVLDGVENADELSLILSLRDECSMLITSQSRQKEIQSNRYDLKPLPFENVDSEAIGLLQYWGGSRIVDKEVALQICKICGGLPLALRLAGSHIEGSDSTASEYQIWLEKEPMTALDLVRRQIEHSLERVSEGAKKALAVIGLLAPGFFNREVVAAALDVSTDETSRLLGELVRYSLLERPENQYRVTHTLIHTYAKEILPASGLFMLQLVLYYITFLQAQGKLGLTDFPRLNVERPHLMAFLARCVEEEEWIAVYSLSFIIAKYLNLLSYSSDYDFVSTSGLVASQVLEDRQGSSAWLQQIGLKYTQPGEEELAIKYYQQSIAIAAEIGDRECEASGLGKLGIAYMSQGRIEQGVECLEQAIAIAREIGNQHYESFCLGTLGATCCARGNKEQGIEYLKQGIAVAREINDRFLEGFLLGELGKVFIIADETEQGMNYCQQALAISRKSGDRRTEANQLISLATVCIGLHAEQAVEYCQQGIAIAREMDDRWIEVAFQSKLWMAYICLDNIEQGFICCEQALATAREIGDHFHEWMILVNLSDMYHTLGYEAEANEAYQMATELDPNSIYSRFYYQKAMED